MCLLDHNWVVLFNKALSHQWHKLNEISVSQIEEHVVEDIQRQMSCEHWYLLSCIIGFFEALPFIVSVSWGQSRWEMLVFILISWREKDERVRETMLILACCFNYPILLFSIVANILLHLIFELNFIIGIHVYIKKCSLHCRSIW